MQHFAVFTREETRKLRQPGRGFCRQDPDERLSLRATAQSPQRIEHRTVGFLASIPFDALTMGDVNGPLTHRDMALEFLGQRGLADPRLPGNKYYLSFTIKCAPPHLAQYLERVATSH